MPNVSLNAFLKILSKGSPQKAQEYGRYLSPGGYDFYWRLKEAAYGLTIGGEPFADCSASILEARDVEKKHNLAALKSLDKWLKVARCADFFDAPVGSSSSPGGFLTVKLEPAFGCVSDGRKILVNLWASQSISLPRNVAGCGLYLMKHHLCTGDFVDCVPTILDLRRRELFIADSLPRTVEWMVASELAWADGFFKASSKAA